jgi:hypothetical protein
MTTTVARRAMSRTRDRSEAVLRVVVPEPVRVAVLGAIVGALLVLIDPLVGAIAALVAAAVGIGLSEARRRKHATLVLYGSVGMMLPALADLIAQMVRLL